MCRAAFIGSRGMSRGGISRGGISRGMSRDGMSRDGMSRGGMSLGGMSLGGISRGGISLGGMSRNGMSRGGMSRGISRGIPGNSIGRPLPRALRQGRWLLATNSMAVWSAKQQAHLSRSQSAPVPDAFGGIDAPGGPEKPLCGPQRGLALEKPPRPPQPPPPHPPAPPPRPPPQSPLMGSRGMRIPPSWGRPSRGSIGGGGRAMRSP